MAGGGFVGFSIVAGYRSVRGAVDGRTSTNTSLFCVFSGITRLRILAGQRWRRYPRWSRRVVGIVDYKCRFKDGRVGVGRALAVCIRVLGHDIGAAGCLCWARPAGRRLGAGVA
jgi:hypothetical protein